MKKNIVLCVLMPLILVGCNIDNSSDNTHSQSSSLLNTIEASSSIIANSENTNNESKDIQSIFDEYLANNRDKTILTWIYNDVVGIPKEVQLEINYELNKLDKNYIIDFKQIPEANYEATINQYIASNKSPDIITAGIGSTDNGFQGTYRAYVNNWLLDLTSYLASPEGKTLYDSVPENCWLAGSVGDEKLGVSTLLPTCTSYAFYVNKDIMSAYNITTSDFENKMPSQISTILEMVDEENCTIFSIFSPDNFLSYIPYVSNIVENRNVQSFAIALNDKTGTAENSFTNDNVIEYYKAIQQYHSKGYMDKNENSFVCLGPYNEFDQSYNVKIIEELKKNYPGLGDMDIIPYYSIPTQTNYNSVTGICSSSNNQAYALDAISAVMTSQTISDLMIYGIEGADYTKTPDGKIQADPFVWIYKMYFGNALITTPTEYEPVNIYEVYKKMPTNVLLGKYINLTDYTAEINEMNEIIGHYIGLIHGEIEDVDTALNEVNTKLKAAGIDKVLAATNKQLLLEE